MFSRFGPVNWIQIIIVHTLIISKQRKQVDCNYFKCQLWSHTMVSSDQCIACYQLSYHFKSDKIHCIDFIPAFGSLLIYIWIGCWKERESIFKNTLFFCLNIIRFKLILTIWGIGRGYQGSHWQNLYYLKCLCPNNIKT